MTNTNVQIENAIKESKGCQFISMSTKTKPSLNKAQKLAASVAMGFDDIVDIEKHTFGQYQIGMSYENAVVNRGAKEQGVEIEFKAETLPWGQWVEGQENKLIENKGELYVRYYLLKNGVVRSMYYVGGKVATDEVAKMIETFCEKKESKRQTDAGLTKNQVKPCNVKISNIMEISIGGVVITRENEDIAVAPAA